MDKEIKLQIDNLGIYGEGVGKHEGLTIFVDGALPKETVQAKIKEKKTNFARAKLLRILEPSPHRTTPICPLFGTCGGCQIMHLDYPFQLEAKRQRVVDALNRIAKLDTPVQPCLPSPKPLAYRNKIQLPVNQDHEMGLYARNSHTLVPIPQCFIHCELGEQAFQKIRPLLKTHRFPLKHVLIKTAVHTKQILVILVTPTNKSPTTLAQEIFNAMPEIQGVVQNINPHLSNTILSSHYKILEGTGSIQETIGELHFKISPASFFQVNPDQAYNLYEHALKSAKLTGQETVLDAYCGVGTLALFCARHAKRVIGIEPIPEAIADANENSNRNHIDNATFICSKAEDEIEKLPPIDVALLNPPRKGCDSTFLKALVTKKPKRLIYISCDPATLARDLQFLTSSGYNLENVQPFDMFPQTMHVETLALLSYEK